MSKKPTKTFVLYKNYNCETEEVTHRLSIRNTFGYVVSGVMAYACKPCIQEAEEGRLKVEGNHLGNITGFN